MPTTFGATYHARDFSQNTADPNRDRWTGGKLRCVIASVWPGQVVNINIDAMTGFTLFDVELVGVRGPGYGQVGDRLLVKGTLSNGDAQLTAYSALNLGPIMVDDRAQVRTGKSPKAIWMEEVGRAIAIARPVAEAEHGQTYGRWTGEVAVTGVRLKYEPQCPSGGPKGYGDVRDGELKSWQTYGAYRGDRTD